MPGHDIIVIGASAGGVEALMQLVGGLPRDLPAAVFIVLHVPPTRSELPKILTRRGPLPASHPRHGEPIEAGRIYVAPPDYHMVVQKGFIELWHGRRENAARPAIDPTFRSAAESYGGRVVGVVLTGNNGDGTIGLAEIKARGGVTIVQDPADAMFDRMPSAAIRGVVPHHVPRLSDIPPLLVSLAHDTAQEGVTEAMPISVDEMSKTIRRDMDEQGRDRRIGTSAIYSCPDCGGVLWQLGEAGLTQFRCHVGHTHSTEGLLEEKSRALEWALWAAVRTLVEKATLTRQLASKAREAGDADAASAIEKLAQRDDEMAHLLQEKFLEASPNPTEQLIIVERQLAGDVNAAG